MKFIFFSIWFLIINQSNINLAQNKFQTNDLVFNSIIDSLGIYVENFNFNPDNLFPKKEWKGNWIWLNEDKYHDYQETFSTWINNDPKRNKKYRALFRKKFTIDDLPEIAVLNITGDVSFRTYLNNELICQGPPNIGSDYDDKLPPEYWFFTSHEILNEIEIGENVLAVEVFSFDLVLSETTSGKGKFICDLDIGSNQTLIFTDSTWKCKLDTSYTNINDVFAFNSNNESNSWKEKNFDDEKWLYASVKNEKIQDFLVQSEIPITFNQKIESVKIIETINGSKIIFSKNDLLNRTFHNSELKLDFGKNGSGFYSFNLTANKNDTVKIFPIEKSRSNRPFIYICKDGKNDFKIPYINIFRYLTLQISSTKGIKINSLDFKYSSYPVSYNGSFTCSDEFYTQLWGITRWTTQMCMQSLYLDSPLHQEPIACTGDYLIESLSNYYAFGDRWLTRQDLIKTAKMLEKNNYDMFHTSYSLLWVQWLADYYRYTADSELLKELVPHVNKLNELFKTYLDEKCLLTQAPDYMFMDWIKIDKFNVHHPPAVIGTGYLTAFYYKSLIESAKLNELLGNSLEKEQNLILAEKIKSAINKYLWDEKKELYKDGIPFLSKVKKHYWLPEDEDIVTYSPHVNTLAVLYDIAPKVKQETIINYVISQDKIDLQPYFTYYVLSAIVHIKKFNSYGLNLLYKWKNGIDIETYTLKENWQNETEFGYVGDYSHAWGGSPLYFMSSIILGITPEKPGYKIIRFTPFVNEKITWAKGEVPIDNINKVEVNWEKEGNSIYKYTIKIPKNYSAVLVHPEEFDEYFYSINNIKKGYAKDNLELSDGKFEIEYKKDNH
ncbi:MAG: alpha-L-rhamnosidase C-terminal domain-containing protein [Melioribacteraceae bacterium]